VRTATVGDVRERSGIGPRARANSNEKFRSRSEPPYLESGIDREYAARYYYSEFTGRGHPNAKKGANENEAYFCE